MTAHHVDKLDAPIRDLDEVLTAAGVQCTLDRFQEWHATTAGRIELIAHQRDQLVAAMEWLEADPTRIAQVSSEIERQKAVAKRNGEAWAARASGISVSEYIDMQTPTIRQVIATLMAPTVDHDALNAKIFAIEHPLPADASQRRMPGLPGHVSSSHTGDGYYHFHLDPTHGQQPDGSGSDHAA